MDPNIDPEMHIESFQKYNNDLSSSSFSSFTSINDEQSSVAAAAVANMSSMINFNSLEDEKNKKKMPFLELDHTQSSVSSSNPKQRLVYDSNSQVSIVVVNPASNEGSGRLGRPRKHTAINSSSSIDTSFKNFDKSMISRFRVDNLPITGPGSRSYTKKDEKKKVQQVLNFNNFKKKEINNEPTITINISDSDEEVPLKKQKIDNQIKESDDDDDDDDNNNNNNNKNNNNNDNNNDDDDDETNLELIDYDNVRGLTTIEPTSRKLNTLKKSNGLFITLKKRKDYPSPLVGLYSDSYQNPQYNDTIPEFNKVAIGYEVKPTPFAKDILYILSFFNKFRHLFRELPNLSPQDFEIGLKLNSNIKYPIKNVNQKVNKTPLFSANDGDGISEFMESLYLRLLTLCLNKKRDLDKKQLIKASLELKNSVYVFGVPKEWRNDTNLFKKKKLNKEPNEEIIDLSNDELLEPELIKYGESIIENLPINSEDFEMDGLSGLSPKDRLILLKSLVQWTLSESNLVKKEILGITDTYSYTEKETYYCSRYIKDGANSIEFSNNNLKIINFKKKPTKGELESSFDATTNPISNPFFLRSLDFFVGDGGNFIGRFYLCRTYNHEIGHLLNGKDIKNLSNKSIDELLLIEQPSNFKLYVEDLSTTFHYDMNPWYEIASNCKELLKFIDFLQLKLTLINAKNLKKLLDYLNEIYPILLKFEEISTDYKSRLTRSSRRKPIQNLKEQDTNYKKLIDYVSESESEYESESEIEVEENDDDDDDEVEFLGEVDED